MKAPAPRTREGKPDFSGIWFANVPAKDYCKEKDCIQEERMAREQINWGINMQGGLPYTEWSKQVMVKRRANGGRDRHYGGQLRRSPVHLEDRSAKRAANPGGRRIVRNQTLGFA